MSVTAKAARNPRLPLVVTFRFGFFSSTESTNSERHSIYWRGERCFAVTVRFGQLSFGTWCCWLWTHDLKWARFGRIEDKFVFLRNLARTERCIQWAHLNRCVKWVASDSQVASSSSQVTFNLAPIDRALILSFESYGSEIFYAGYLWFQKSFILKNYKIRTVVFMS